MNNLIVPMCIYNLDGPEGPVQSYIGNPVLNSNNKYVCEGPSQQPWYFFSNLYALNPMFTAIPTYMKLICAKKSNVADASYGTVEVINNYDPYNLNNQCVYFITWTQPVPYTTPLYIYHSNGGILSSFEKRDDLKEAFLSPIYVLTDDPRPTTLIPPGGTWFNKVDGKAQFKFKSRGEHCIPNPDGSTFLECNLNNDLSLNRPESLLGSLRKDEEDVRGSSKSIDKFYDRLGVGWVALVLGLFFISLGCLALIIKTIS